MMMEPKRTLTMVLPSKVDLSQVEIFLEVTLPWIDTRAIRDRDSSSACSNSAESPSATKKGEEGKKRHPIPVSVVQVPESKLAR